jgi:hypothetical protein
VIRTFAALGFSLALAATPAMAQSPSPERAALLARLKAAIPPSNAPPFGQEDAEKVREVLLPLNPGKERQVEALAAGKFACLNSNLSDAKVLDLIIASVDESMSQPDIERLVAFYEGPEHKALVASQDLPDGDPRKEEAVRKLAADSAFMSFLKTMQDGIRAYMTKPGVMEAIMACETTYQADLEQSGLTQP